MVESAYSWFKDDLPIFLSGASLAISIFSIVWGSKASSRASLVDASHHQFTVNISDPIHDHLKELKNVRKSLASFELLPDDATKIRENISNTYRGLVNAQDNLVESLEKSDRSKFSASSNLQAEIEPITESILTNLDKALNPQVTDSCDELKGFISKATSQMETIDCFVINSLEKETLERYNLSIWPFGNPFKKIWCLISNT